MGFVKALVNRLFFGGEKQQEQQIPQEVSVQLVGRKRPLEEEEEEHVSQVSKNSLNRPIKRARMEEEGPTSSRAEAPELDNLSMRNFFKSFKSFFGGSKVKTKTVAAAEFSDGAEAGNPFDPSVETVDLTGDLSGNEGNEENLPLSVECPPSQSSLPSSSSSTLATLSSFGGFTAASLSSLQGPAGHVVSTSREARRRVEAASPERVKARLAGGAPSRHDNFFSEKNIAKRIWRKPSEYGGVSKSGKKNRGRTAFHHTTDLQEKERYRAMLERYGVVRYSALTDRSELFRPVRPGSLLGPGPVRASLDLMSGVKRVDEAVRAKPVLTSTVVKPGLSSSSPPTSDLAASPVLPREKASPVSVRSPAQSVLTADDSELAATVREVTSPEFLERFHRKYGAVARERELQIQREESRKKNCEKDTENVISLIDERLLSHLKITQVCSIIFLFSISFLFPKNFLRLPLMRLHPETRSLTSPSPPTCRPSPTR